MKSDLDELMQAHNLDALLVVGAASHNPPMVYLTGGAQLTQAELIKVRGQPAQLYCRPMERDEAARTGLAIRIVELRQEQADLAANGNDALRAEAARIARLLTDHGVAAGRVALLGRMDAGAAVGVFSQVKTLLPELQIVGQGPDSILMQAMAVKDPQEIERIRRVGAITTEVIHQTADFLCGHATHDDVLIRADGDPLTIGDVRRRINLWLAERGLENPHSTIFAIGSDAGVPHSVGMDRDPLRLGRTIVFDIFPCEPGGGYFYDITRTWCLEYADERTLQVYADVVAVYQQLHRELRLGVPARDYQLRCCELFEARGYPTVRSDPQTQKGYVHGLGHGIGLNLHEYPVIRASAAETGVLAANMVITLEPGLYDPEAGYGVRLEDTLWARPDGVFEPLAEYPFDLVLPMRKK